MPIILFEQSWSKIRYSTNISMPYLTCKYLTTFQTEVNLWYWIANFH